MAFPSACSPPKALRGLWPQPKADSSLRCAPAAAGHVILSKMSWAFGPATVHENARGDSLIRRAGAVDQLDFSRTPPPPNPSFAEERSYFQSSEKSVFSSRRTTKFAMSGTEAQSNQKAETGILVS
jgi:hypothetical protein